MQYRLDHVQVLHQRRFGPIPLQHVEWRHGQALSSAGQQVIERRTGGIGSTVEAINAKPVSHVGECPHLLSAGSQGRLGLALGRLRCGQGVGRRSGGRPGGQRQHPPGRHTVATNGMAVVMPAKVHQGEQREANTVARPTRPEQPG